jgi:hypothetical protein
VVGLVVVASSGMAFVPIPTIAVQYGVIVVKVPSTAAKKTSSPPNRTSSSTIGYWIIVPSTAVIIDVLHQHQERSPSERKWLKQELIN